MDAKTLTFKKRQRHALQVNANKEINKASQFSVPDSSDKYSEIEVCITKLNEYKTKLNNLNTEIIFEIEDDEEGIAETQSATDWDDNLLATSALLSSKLKLYQTEPVNNNSEQFGSQQSLATVVTRSPQSVKLPKLEINKYSGEALKWQEFWDSFSSTIHTNSELSQIDKFKYLHRYLDGDALGLVVGYRLTAENYDTVIEALKERYGNPQVAIFSHFEAMLSLPVASHDTQQLQHTFDECERHIRSLIALGLHEDTFGQVFTPIIISKLPIYVKMELYRRNGRKMWTLQNLRDTLKEEIMARNLSSASFGTKPDTRSKNSHDKRSDRSQTKHTQKGSGSSASLLAEGTKNTNKASPKCSFCSGKHYSDACTEYPDLQSRRANLKGRCFKCLSSRHVAKDCEVKYSCAYCKSNRHHRALCPVKFGSNETSTAACADFELQEDEMEHANPVNSTLLSHNERVHLQTSLTKIRGTTTNEARMLFDTGCSRTFITSKIAKQIGARSVGEEVVSIAGFSDTKRKTVKYPIVDFEVLLHDGSSLTLTANVTQTISCPVQRYPIDLKKHPMVKQLVLSEPVCTKNDMVNIDVLIGSDYYYDIVGTERIQCPDGPLFIASKVGFIATGRVGQSNSNYKNKTTVASLLLHKSNDDVSYDTTFQVEKFWSLEDIGIKTPTCQNEDDEVLENFKKTVVFKDGRYAVKWPWKCDASELPQNYYLALGRLKSLLKRLQQDEKLFDVYDQTIKDQETKGVIERVEQLETDNKIHYIPHHCVVTPGKATTKVRVVYDASAKQSKNQPSINECLHRGPVILDDLCGLLMRFRLHKVGLVSDIEKAFLQVALQDDSRDVTRFIWIKDPKKPATGDNLVVFRFCRVPFGFISSPFLLGGTVKCHLAKSATNTAKDIDDSMYVDNVINGKPSVDDAINFYFEAKKLFATASMNLREWFTNSPEVKAVIADKDRGQTTETKVLGMVWDTKEDVLSCQSLNIQAESVNTKRLMLKYLAKIFDPCGYFSAVTVAGKLLIQKLWQEKFDWDDVLPSNFTEEWTKIAQSLEEISQQKIDRYILHGRSTHSRYTLHCFCDASAKAYSAVVYLVEITEQKTTSNLIFAKSRVAPVKSLSIPRLELLALLIGSRLIAFTEDQLKLHIAEKWIWSDSQCVLHWLVKPTISTVFVRNRISEIKALSGVKFRYVPTTQNPADISSRGCSSEHLKESEIWWNGPEFLLQPKENWPRGITSKVPENEDSNIIKPESKPEHSQTLLATDDQFRLKPENFSSLTRLLRITALVRRFINNARKKKRHHGELSAEEIAEAQNYWEHRVQTQNFDFSTTSKLEELRKKYKQLDIFVDNSGLLRCGSRLIFAEMSDDMKRPILLPKNNAFTDLIIRKTHEDLFHAPSSHTLAQVREKYWIIHGRPQVKRVRRSCQICKLRFGGPFKLPKFPQLPKFRVTRQKPFQTVGIDYMGPLKIKEKSTGEERKVWICIFTCTAIRAIHLEVIESLSTEQFLLCLRRFSAKYDAPATIVCDNAKYFKTAQDTLLKIWREIQNDVDVKTFSANKGIQWKFITELAPWMGGFYERLVGIVKRSLKCVLDSRRVSLVELQTVITEVAAIVNSRPLLYSEDDPFENTLTPAHFISGPCCGLPTLPSADNDNYEPKTLKSDELTLYYRKQQKILDSFWSIWQNQYLASLRGYSNCHKQRSVSDIKPTIGTVVLMKENSPRCMWKLGIITKVKISADEQIRSASVKVANGKIYNRPLKLLFPLELSVEKQPSSDEPSLDVDNKVKRKAATVAEQRIKHILNDEA